MIRGICYPEEMVEMQMPSRFDARVFAVNSRPLAQVNGRLHCILYAFRGRTTEYTDKNCKRRDSGSRNNLKGELECLFPAGARAVIEKKGNVLVYSALTSLGVHIACIQGYQRLSNANWPVGRATSRRLTTVPRH